MLFTSTYGKQCSSWYRNLSLAAKSPCRAPADKLIKSKEMLCVFTDHQVFKIFLIVLVFFSILNFNERSSIG